MFMTVEKVYIFLNLNHNLSQFILCSNLYEVIFMKAFSKDPLQSGPTYELYYFHYVEFLFASSGQSQEDGTRSH